MPDMDDNAATAAKLTRREKDARLRHRVFNVGKVCIDCGESLTKAEQQLEASYCLACWPLADRKEQEDAT